MLARIPADVSKRLNLFALALALTAAACNQAAQPGAIDLGQGRRFVPMVADSIDDVGLQGQVTVGKDGVPYMSYWGFPAVLKEGEIPIGRPIGAPFLTTKVGDPASAVMVASVSNGIFTRGAAAMPQEAPGGVIVPFGPATVDSLSGAKPANVNGTDIAVAEDGSLHVAWTGQDGLWYAGGSGTFAASHVLPLTSALSTAGPMGWPSVAVDDSGTPWVAVTTTSFDGQQVLVASPDGDEWKVMTASPLEICSGCDQPARTQIVATSDGPVVLYVDTAAGAVSAARFDGKSWTTETVETGVAGSGLSLAVDEGGGLHAAYYSGKGEIHVATSSAGGGWTISKPENTGDPAPGASTGIAVDGSGKVYVTWHDSATKTVELAAADGSTFTAIDTLNTAGGTYPDVAVSPDGASVFLTWYDPAQGNLMLGLFGESDDIVVAEPSPTTEASVAPTGGPECPKGGIIITAASGAASAGFSETSVEAPTDELFTLCFDNKDSGVPHNLAVLDAEGGTSISASSVAPGPVLQVLEVPAQPVGELYFQCDVHPNMNGKLIVK